PRTVPPPTPGDGSAAAPPTGCHRMSPSLQTRLARRAGPVGRARRESQRLATGLNRSTIYVADPGAGCGKGEKRVQRVECSFDGIDPGGVARACQCAGAALGGESGAYLALR